MNPHHLLRESVSKHLALRDIRGYKERAAGNLKIVHKTFPCKVPPMPADKTRAVLEHELRGVPIEDVFEWIDLENVLGSASIAQVYLAATLSFAVLPKHLVNDVTRHPSPSRQDIGVNILLVFSPPCPSSMTGQNLADRMQVHKAKLKRIRKSRRQELTRMLLAPEHQEQPEGMQI